MRAELESLVHACATEDAKRYVHAAPEPLPESDLIAYRARIAPFLRDAAAHGKTNEDVVFATTAFYKSDPALPYMSIGALIDLPKSDALRTWLGFYVASSYWEPKSRMGKIVGLHEVATHIQAYARQIVAGWPGFDISVTYSRQRLPEDAHDPVLRYVDHGLFFDWQSKILE